MQDQTGTVVVMICALLVAMHVVAELAVRPGMNRVCTSKSPCWYIGNGWEVADAELLGTMSRFNGGRPAAAGRMMGVASMAISGRKSRGLSVSCRDALGSAVDL